MDTDATTVFDSLPDLESSVSEEMKANLVYISGYVTRKLNVEGKDYDDNYCYYEKYGRYLTSLARGGLSMGNFLLYNIRRDENQHLQKVADVRISTSLRCLQS